MKRRIWQIFKDEDRKLFEILGTTADDTLLRSRTAEMLNYDIYAQCDTPPAATPRESLMSTFQGYGYTYKEGLFQELCGRLDERRAYGAKKSVTERWTNKRWQGLRTVATHPMIGLLGLIVGLLSLTFGYYSSKKSGDELRKVTNVLFGTLMNLGNKDLEAVHDKTGLLTEVRVPAKGNITFRFDAVGIGKAVRAGDAKLEQKQSLQEGGRDKKQ